MPFFNLNRPLGLLTGVAVLVAACSKSETTPEPVRAVRTMIVTSHSAGGLLEFAAEIRARTEVRLGFRVPGKMLSRAAEVGQQVKAGQVLARLDPNDLELARAASTAAVNAAQVNHDLSLADYKRFKDLRDQGFISSAELDRREAALKSAVALLEQAKALAGVQGNQAGYSSLVAHAGGIVLALEAEPGAVLAAGASVLRLAIDGPRDAVFAVPEDMVGVMRPLIGRVGGIAVQIWGGGPTLRATVREVAAAADPATRTFQVKAGLAAPEVQLGRTATVSIELPPRSALARLPLSAVAEHKGRSVVWVLDPGRLTVHVRPIEVAGAEGNEVLVAQGLKPGDEVVTAGVHVLSDGQTVKRMVAMPESVSAASR